MKWMLAADLGLPRLTAPVTAVPIPSRLSLYMSFSMALQIPSPPFLTLSVAFFLFFASEPPRPVEPLHHSFFPGSLTRSADKDKDLAIPEVSQRRKDLGFTNLSWTL
jgi:hypothetical protein